MNSSRFALSKISSAALILASVALTGCSSNGTLRVAGPDLPDPPVLVQSVIGTVASNTGAKTSSVGGVVSAVGSSIATTEMAGIDNGVMIGTGAAVQQVGNAVDILGTGTGNSFGEIGREEANQTGQEEADILAIKMASGPLIATQVGGAVSSVGDAVAAVDNGQLNALSPVTDPAGALLNETGAGIASLSGSMTEAMNNAVVQQVTSSGSAMIHMVAIDVEDTTQNLGDSTGLGVTAKNLLSDVGLAVKSIGDDITSNSSSPLVSSAGGVVTAAGTLVASLGGLVTSPTSDNSSPSTFGNAINSLTSVAAPGLATSSPLAALSSQPALSNLLGSLPSTPAQGTTPAPISGALAPVTTPFGGVLGGLPAGLNQ
jgi:hypothetical protein